MGHTDTDDQCWTGKPMDYLNYPAHFVLWMECQPYDPGWARVTAVTQGSIMHVTATTRDVYWDGGWAGTYGFGWGAGLVTTEDPPVWGMWSWDPPTDSHGGGCSGQMEGRHLGNVNCAFLDGHAKAEPISELYNKESYYFNASAKNGVHPGQAAQTPGQSIP
jgi:prepilin-type processing-associated H-X9-DG protein